MQEHDWSWKLLQPCFERRWSDLKCWTTTAPIAIGKKHHGFSTHLGGCRAAEIARQQDRTENRGARNNKERHADQLGNLNRENQPGRISKLDIRNVALVFRKGIGYSSAKLFGATKDLGCVE
jgi:hypothetical protein